MVRVRVRVRVRLAGRRPLSGGGGLELGRITRTCLGLELELGC